VRYIELFAGAGGLSIGLESAGMTAVAHAEIEPHARAVLRHHWPDVPLHGDVAKVDWTQYAGRVGLVAGGSPCQDLSVAGKRAGLAGARSGLFYEQIRAWEETQAPYFLWENVSGALSSSKGEDFAAILSALVGSPVAAPAKQWTSAGVVAGATGVAAWRVLDLQHFGPPQRRRRVFVVAARTGGVDPAEVLALAESLCGHPSPREQSREAVTGSLSARTQGGGGLGTDFELSGGIQVVPLQAGAQQAVFAFEPRYYTRDNKTVGAPSDLVALTASVGKAGDAAPHVVPQQAIVQTLVVGGRDKGAGDSYDNTPVVLAIAFHLTQDPVSAVEATPCLGVTSSGMGVVSATGDITHALTSEGCDASEDGTGRGTPIVVALRGRAGGSMAECSIEVPALRTPGVGSSHPIVVGNTTLALYPRPRRLTPRECERLMSWADGHTATGTREDGTPYALSDTARYRLCGNGVGSVVTEWIGRRFIAALGPTP
jgi:DNA (cytosine-5)-methyltransferase 1